jgi:hypothetical protein
MLAPVVENPDITSKKPSVKLKLRSLKTYGKDATKQSTIQAIDVKKIPCLIDIFLFICDLLANAKEKPIKEQINPIIKKLFAPYSSPIKSIVAGINIRTPKVAIKYPIIAIIDLILIRISIKLNNLYKLTLYLYN